MAKKSLSRRDSEVLLAALEVSLTTQQWRFFNEESENLLIGPAWLKQSRIVPVLKKKELLERESVTNALERLEVLTPLGREVALLFADPPTPAEVATKLRESLNLDFFRGFSRGDVTDVLPKLRGFSALLRWHALDCFEVQGGAFDARVRQKIQWARQRIASGQISDGVEVKPAKATDDSILDGLVNLKAYIKPWEPRYHNQNDFKGSAKRAREYAIDRNPPLHRFPMERDLVHWQGMQLLHLCEAWVACGERMFQAWLDGTLPIPRLCEIHDEEFDDD